MNYKDVESWFRAARDNPVKAAGLLLAALALAFLFSFASQGAQRVARILDNRADVEPAPPVEPAPTIVRSVPVQDWLDTQKQERGDSP